MKLGAVISLQQENIVIQQKREPANESISSTEIEINDQPVPGRKTTPQSPEFSPKPIVDSSPVNIRDQERLTTQEWKAKNQAWLDWYKRPWGCENCRSDEHMVECTNHKMKAKKEFESLWSQGKIPH